MGVRGKIQQILLEISSGQGMPELKKEFLDDCANEFQREDGVFMISWQKILEENKESIIKSAVKEVLMAMTDEEKKEILEKK